MGVLTVSPTETLTIRFAGTIPQEDLAAIAQAVEEGCEQVDPNEQIRSRTGAPANG